MDTDTDFIRLLPDHVLTTQLCPFFGFKDYALTGCASSYLQAHWQTANQQKPLPLYVPEDCSTLKEAVKRVHEDNRLTTIVLGKGTHVVAVYQDEYDNDINSLEILSAMNIVGDPKVPKSNLVVVGGIDFKEGIQGNCHLQHLTLRQATRSGVYGLSSFTMEDVLVEQCGDDPICGCPGVYASGIGVTGRCTNVEVRDCEVGGVAAVNDASITLIGDKTTVHHNCTQEGSNGYGLEVDDPSSTIQLVAPLTKEQVSIDNGGYGNWGASENGDINQIKTITKAEFTAVLAQEAAIASRIDALSQTIKATASTSLTVNMPEDSNLNEFVTAVHLVNTDKNFTAGRTITIVLGKGEHQIDGYYLDIFSAMNIVGDPKVPKSNLVVVGAGILYRKGIQGNCHLQHLTLRQPKEVGARGHSYYGKGTGVYAMSSFTMEDVLVEQCGGHGVDALGKRVTGRCTNVEVRQCGKSGVRAGCGASIILVGAKTKVHHNYCTTFNRRLCYGLQVYSSSSSTIQLISPLTKEQVSFDNGGGGNWGAEGGSDAHQIKSTTETEMEAVLAAAAAIFASGKVRVPEDCKTLKEAVDRVREDRLTTIVVGQGEHQVDGDSLEITSAMNIVGDPGAAIEEIVVVGGIALHHWIRNCHLQHLTIRQAKGSGVECAHSSFTMEDVIVEQCGGNGVAASGTGVVGKCTNVEVRRCGSSGVMANKGASITLIGAQTTVHHNCTEGDSHEYGLKVTCWSSSSTIQLVCPLTKEQISINNGGGGNWGAPYGGDINQIKTIDEPATGETKSNH